MSAICRFFSHYMPSHTYTSVTLQQDVVASLHRDLRNEEGSSHLLVSLTPAYGPILWVEEHQGISRCPDASCTKTGTLLGNPARFDPRVLHCTVVSSGHVSDRIVAVAFTVRQPERLPDQRKRTLLDLGFNVPTTK